MTTPRVALYLRCSTQEQSTELQLRELKEYVGIRGWNNVSFYEDKASGTTNNRAELRKLLNEVQRGKIDIVLTWKLDRLARSLRDLINMLDLFAHLGVSLVSLKENIDMTSSTGRLLVHLIGAFAQFERDLIVQRVKAGLQNARAKGKRLGRPKKRDDAKIKALRNQGLSIRQIARELCISAASIQRALAVYRNRTSVTEAKAE